MPQISSSTRESAPLWRNSWHCSVIVADHCGQIRACAAKSA
ncbi:hypothetical protein BN931_1279 [Bifidobacterium animalis subsp. lactis CECT 8145]|nr:hypothetical protein BAA6_0326 [Bifidobacterium animalis]QIR80356.1 hypothetical protein M8PIadj_0335 [Bifidobacterium animalis]CDL72056.1 hypothetical protein BN931_1279 [Bifidobacterium animalis subsp. lactis CECT 8145]